ncbi:MAG: winged helix-turn-helix domain-containing protein [Halohasta sp.]|uniref:winged helix-turn-helix domain-containing protein n=1 Tax=Halohasta salina TaxID=2961621 RepID=UPI0020A474BA|nr:winged helix-turn-helix domain-containing protein [Halohasta salina]
MAEDWDEIGFVISSQYRIAVLKRLSEGPATPSRIAEDSGIGITHVSRALGRLRERKLVELLVPEERKKGRVYGVTDRGEELWDQIQAKNLID